MTFMLPKLDEEQKDEFWKKWALVYMEDEELVRELAGNSTERVEMEG